MEYRQIIEKAIAQKKLNKKMVQKLKKLPGKKLDELFRDEDKNVFQEIECLSCANCCKTTSPIFRDVDILRLSKRLRLTTATFIKNYLKMDNENDYVLQSSPCTFLLEDNKCSVYEDRPLACKEYPHTNRKKMHQILNLSLKNAEVCPAVAQIFENFRKINFK